MTEKNHIHCIGIGGIGISALARYYLAQGFRVTGTNMGHSPLLETLASEAIEIVADGASVICENTAKIIYTEAIIDDHTLGLAGVRLHHQPEIQAGQKFGAEILSYPEALAQVFDSFPMKIAVAGAHGKSTTSAMIGTVLHDLQAPATTITGTLVKAFGGKNISVGNICKIHSSISPFQKGETGISRRGILDSEKSTRLDCVDPPSFQKEGGAHSPFGKGDVDSAKSGRDRGILPNGVALIPYREDLKEKARELRKNMTGPEKKLWKYFLRKDGLGKYRFLRQKPLGNYIVDFYCQELNLVIELDGFSHHGQEAYDARRDEELQQCGLTILHISNDEVLCSFDAVCDMLVKIVQQNPPASLRSAPSFQKEGVMVIEACEYRNAFLHYHPDIAVITNIDPDHLDFFKTAEAYSEAFEKFMGQAKCVVMLASEFNKIHPSQPNVGTPSFQKEGGNNSPFGKGDTGVSRRGILDWKNPPTSSALADSALEMPFKASLPFQKEGAGTQTFIIVHPNHFEVLGNTFNDIQPGKYPFILPKLLVPGDHVRLDASLAYVVSQLLHLNSEQSLQSLAKYPGSWRRMEVIGTTKHSNLVISDYGHHPTEIQVTLKALRNAHPTKKLIVFFEPHQYSRTYELRDEFSTSFKNADMTYISDIYAARDIDERREMINSKMLAEMVAKHSSCEYVGTLDDARKKLLEVDAENSEALILLLGAGNIDELRDVV